MSRLTYTITPIPDDALQQQREAFAALIENLRQSSPAGVGQALAEREEVAPETGLDPEVVARVRRRIADASA